MKVVIILFIMFLFSCLQTINANNLYSNKNDTTIIATDSNTIKMEINSPFSIDLFGFTTSVSVELTEEMKKQLDELISYLKNNPTIVVHIEGHSDNSGTVQQQIERAEARKNAAVNYFLEQEIQLDRIIHRGRAGLKPIDNNATPEGRYKNRRISIEIE